MAPQAKPAKRLLRIPNYSLSEELISSISHGVGALLGVAALVLCIVRAASHHDPWAVVSGSVFGGSIILLYAVSSIYHALKVNRAKRVLRVMDHCTIFVLIAGTYTPYTLVALRGPVGWVLFSLIWAAGIAGIIFNAIDVERFKIASMVNYIIMGWAIIFAFKPLSAVIGRNALVLLLCGGVAYTVGAVLYGLGSKIKYMHSIWHFFVLAGTVLHFLSIYLYVL